jgi:hypothetical protein
MPKLGTSWSGTLAFTNGEYVFPTGVTVEELRTTGAGDLRIVRHDYSVCNLHPIANDIMLGERDWKKVTAFGTTPALEGAVHFRGVYNQTV